ncbi:MAG TPA: serine acetyltransferase [Methylibium sp.]|uniref:serine O-acetyltransferase n=1 Tax=Methylibium sp. TaxID=2067992 RepID=UPI002DB8EF6C|nr:serine acetyltransferase [Methylibium sp.]HEU4457563.1 serine acetyltransferase [Methylibium sp.]
MSYPPITRTPPPSTLSLHAEPGLWALIREDLANHGGRWGAQGFWALAVHRFGTWRYRIRSPLLRKPLSALYKLLFKLVQIAAGIELPCEAKVGRGVVIDHFGGIIVSGYAVIGDGVRLRQGVSIGLAHCEEPCAPVIGKHVEIGAGAKLMGRITIGDHAMIGANAVVLKDVPAHHLAIGVPARIRSRKREEAAMPA